MENASGTKLKKKRGKLKQNFFLFPKAKGLKVKRVKKHSTRRERERLCDLVEVEDVKLLQGVLFS